MRPAPSAPCSALARSPRRSVCPRPLEEDLWVAPLRDGLREALAITGATSARRLRESPVVVTVGGHVAADLELLGLTGRRPSVWSKLDPRPPARRLKAARRVGRLRVALPALADDLIADIDADLRTLPAVNAPTPRSSCGCSAAPTGR